MEESDSKFGNTAQILEKGSLDYLPQACDLQKNATQV